MSADQVKRSDGLLVSPDRGRIRVFGVYKMAIATNAVDAKYREITRPDFGRVQRSPFGVPVGSLGLGGL